MQAIIGKSGDCSSARDDTGRPGITGHNPGPGAGSAQPRRWSIAVVRETFKNNVSFRRVA
jgi:hypothetical protein